MVRGNMAFPWILYQNFWDFIIIIIPVIFVISLTLELFILFIFEKKNNILNHSKFIKYILFANLISFPFTQFFVIFPWGLGIGYYFSLLPTLATIQIVPMTIEYLILSYLFKKLYNKGNIEYEITNCGPVIVLANLFSFSIGWLIYSFIPV
ncbi:MAG: hypothetical protein JXA99_06450 [Candidatus Lokiarchaeota archaeon]|nr:hypothetical protein [Candidatus Lokiarchaeota archaeon]